MKLKVYPEYVGLCGSCRYATIAKTVNADFLITCSWFDNIRGPIVLCSKYDDRRLPSLQDMQRTAWILQTDENRKLIGFVSNRKWRKSKEYQNNPYWGDADD